MKNPILLGQITESFTGRVLGSHAAVDTVAFSDVAYESRA